MAYIPYGYRIIDGKAVIDEEEAQNVRDFFHQFLELGIISKTAKTVNINKTHSVITRILKTRHI